jgi:hypothetical protein
MQHKPKSPPPKIELINIHNVADADDAMLRNLANKIWQDPERATAAGTSFVSVKYKFEQKNNSTQYYVIFLNNVKIVGIIGHFEYPTTEQILGITWSGILPEYQKQGIYKAALEELTSKVKIKYPKARHLEEIVPQGTRYNRLICIFKQLGFLIKGIHYDNDILFDKGTRMWLNIAQPHNDPV